MSLLEAELLGHPVAEVIFQAKALVRLAELERERGGLDWVENHIGRLHDLAGLAGLAEKQRALAYYRETAAADERLQAQMGDEALLPEVERLRAAGVPLKAIQTLLFSGKENLGKARLARIVRLGKEKAAHMTRINAAKERIRAPRMP